MLRVLVIVVALASTAHADAQVAVLAGTAWRPSNGVGSHVAPGPGFAVDLISSREGFSIGGHLGWISGWNRTTWNGTSSDLRYFDSLLQVHVLFQYRADRFTLGGGLGIDDHHASGYYVGMPPSDQSALFENHAALGVHLQASYDVASIDAGTFAATAGAGIFHIFHPADFCSGECTAPGQTYALWVGVAFRFR